MKVASPDGPAAIDYADFQRLVLAVGTVTKAVKVADTDRLIRFELDFGDHQRTIVGGWALAYPDPSVLVGTQLVALVNLAPRTIRGIESQGMLLSAVDNDQPIALHPDRPVPPGSIVR